MKRREAYTATFKFFKVVKKFGFVHAKGPDLKMWLKVRALILKKLEQP